MESNSHTLRGTVLVLIAGCCFGSIAPLTLIARQAGASVQAVQSWRHITAAVILIAVGWILDRRNASDPVIPGALHADTVKERRWYHPLILLGAGTGQTAVATLSLLALDWISAATTAFLFYTYPVWVAVIMAVRGVERITTLRAMALVIALAGITAMIGTPSAGDLHPTGVALALLGALVYAVFIPMLAVMQQGRTPLDISRAIAVGGALLFTVWTLLTGGLLESLGLVEWLASAGQGVLSAAAFVGLLAGLRDLGPVRTAITATIEPFWTAVLAALLLSQPVGAGTMIGGGAIITAVVLLQLRPRRASA